MKITGNTMFITKGMSGIGYALAKHFLALHNEVIFCGRRESRLNLVTVDECANWSIEGFID